MGETRVRCKNINQNGSNVFPFNHSRYCSILNVHVSILLKKSVSNFLTWANVNSIIKSPDFYNPNFLSLAFTKARVGIEFEQISYFSWEQFFVCQLAMWPQ